MNCATEIIQTFNGRNWMISIWTKFKFNKTVLRTTQATQPFIFDGNSFWIVVILKKMIKVGHRDIVSTYFGVTWKMRSTPSVRVDSRTERWNSWLTAAWNEYWDYYCFKL